jgi:L-2-hydroxyglutarate oxidase LhgO
VVATTPEEEPALEKLLKQATANGIEDVVWLSKNEAIAMEPEISVHSALLLTETGIIDTHSLMKALESDTTKNNGTIVYGSAVINIEKCGTEFRIKLADGEIISSRFLINSAGLSAIDVSAMLNIIPEKLYPCKGVYFYYSGKHSVKHLVYPIPEKNLSGLGIHATIDMAGRLRFGPDVEYVTSIDDYSVEENKLDKFHLAAKHLFPGVEREKMQPDMAGIRPKIQGIKDSIVKDFYIKDESSNGCSGYINLLGIESPGLTSCLAIAEEVYGLLGNN